MRDPRFADILAVQEDSSAFGLLSSRLFLFVLQAVLWHSPNTALFVHCVKHELEDVVQWYIEHEPKDVVQVFTFIISHDAPELSSGGSGSYCCC